MIQTVDFAFRLILGISLIVFAVNGTFLLLTGSILIPMPAPNSQMKVGMTGVFAFGYLFPLVKIIEFVSAILFLSNKYINFAIVILTPVFVNILGIRLFVDQSLLPIVAPMCAMLIFLIWVRWDAFKRLISE